MNKYIKALFCVPLAGIKCAILKIEHGKDFSAKCRQYFRLLPKSRLTKIAFKNRENTQNAQWSKNPCTERRKLKIGRNFGMSNDCVVTTYENISIGDNVMLGPNVLIYDQDHDYKAEGGVAAMKFKTAPIMIGNNVWTGANSIILRGTVLGDNCVVGGTY